MQSIKHLYKIGRGPSSSHTMGPYYACLDIKHYYEDADEIEVTLYNSLALTGEGHLTYSVIEETLKNYRVTFKTKIDLNMHPNTMIFKIFKNKLFIEEVMYKSIGGGDILKNDETFEKVYIYPHKNFKEIKQYCESEHIGLYDYLKRYEAEDIDAYLKMVWNQLKQTIETGLNAEGILPGKLQVQRKAKELYNQKHSKETDSMKEYRLVSSYAFSVNEENASGGIIVTTPTCGASGVLPAVLYYMHKDLGYSEDDIIKALGVAAIIGNVVKHNATISGAVGGCQAEVGTACSMAAAAHASLLSTNLTQIEYAAEIALEHNLGLTCDPIDGYVQIPCIERNAVAAIRAMSASQIAYFLSGSRKISFDMIVKTMLQTGLDMHPKYKETSEAGMAYFYNNLND
ncbi:MAG: L-serine ammonia-lyase, iron-sulfur-dependent, subunit alpha [Bacilli bacterium]